MIPTLDTIHDTARATWVLADYVKKGLAFFLREAHLATQTIRIRSPGD